MIWEKRKDICCLILAIKRKTCLTNGVLPEAQSCLSLFLFAAPFPHKDAVSHNRVLLLFCAEKIQMQSCAVFNSKHILAHTVQ